MKLLSNKKAIKKSVKITWTDMWDILKTAGIANDIPIVNQTMTVEKSADGLIVEISGEEVLS